MYTTSFPSRISFSSMDASGLLRFVAKNTNTQNSRFGSDCAPGKGNQPPPFPGGVQHLACVLHLTSSEQVTYLGLVHLCPGWPRDRYRKKRLLVLCKGWWHCCDLKEVTTVESGAEAFGP